MVEIVSIKEAKKQPDQSVIAILEDILAKAKQGELIEFQLVGRCSDGDIVTASAGERRKKRGVSYVRRADEYSHGLSRQTHRDQ